MAWGEVRPGLEALSLPLSWAWQAGWGTSCLVVAGKTLRALSFFEKGWALPAELEFVSSSLPEVPEAFTSSFEANSAATGGFCSRGAEPAALLVIQSS